LIKCDKSEDGIKFDLTGADIVYSSKLKSVTISMANYCRKLLERFDMLECKPKDTPDFIEANLYDISSVKSNFPYKAAVGALQWATTCARPDLAHSVNMLARAGANPVTKAMEKCARTVMRYIKGTIDASIGYSPQKEQRFQELCSQIADHVDNSKLENRDNMSSDPLHIFADASFGTEYKAFKSISGVVVFLYGAPIAWKSRVQTVFSSSTTQSEWIALSDAIEYSSTLTGMRDFLMGRSELDSDHPAGPLYCDNRAAVLNARKDRSEADELARASRHVALKFASVTHNNKRLLWTPTDRQLADGLTKSGNRQALINLLCPPTTVHKTVNITDNESVPPCYYSNYLNLE